MKYIMSTPVAYPKEGVTKLKERLGYGRPRQKRDSQFSQALRAYISNYQTRSKIAGQGLYKWNEHSNELNDMVLDFLQEEKKGPFYWPDGETSFNFGPLQYSKHDDQIASILKQLIFKINTQGRRRRSNLNVNPNTLSRRQEPQQSSPNQPTCINVDNLPEPASPRRDQSTRLDPTPRATQPPRRSQSPRADQSQEKDQAPRIDRISRPTQQYVPEPAKAGAEEAPSLQPATREQVDPRANYEGRTSITNEPETQQYDTTYRGISPDNIYDVTPSPNALPEEFAERSEKRKQDALPRQDVDYLRAKRARYQHATTSNALGPSSADNMGASPVGAFATMGLSWLSHGLRTVSSNLEHQDIGSPDYYYRHSGDIDGYDAVDSIESHVFQDTLNHMPKAPIARMDRQDTVETVGRDIEPAPADSNREDTSPRAGPQFVVSPLPSRISARLPRIQRNVRATTEFPVENRHPSSFILHKIDQESIRNLPNGIQISTPNKPPSPTERSGTAANTPTTNTPTTPGRPRHATPDRRVKFSVYVTPHCCKLWRLEGDFKAKSLKQLVDEMKGEFQLESNFTELSLILSIAEQTFEDRVELGNERGFEEIKLRFSAKLKAQARSSRGPGGMLDPVLEISFEPLWKDVEIADEDDRGWVSSAA